jgi:tetratricopeptide (TPR) repeat protein
LLDQAAALSKLAEAVQAGDRGLALVHELGDAAAEVAARTTQGWNRTQLGDLEGARRTLEEGLSLARSLGFERGQAGLLGNLAIVYTRTHELPAAVAAHERALEIHVLLGDKAMQGRTLHNLGRTLSELGDLPGARRRMEESIALRRALGDKQGLARSLGSLGAMLVEQDDLEAAEKATREALSLAEENRLQATAATYRVSLGDVLRERGRLLEAEALERAGIAQHRKEGRTDFTASGLAILAETQLAAGRPLDALRSVEEARELVARSRDRTTTAYVEMVSAYVRALAGEPAQRAQALRELEAAAERLGKASALELQLMARLYLGLALRQAGAAGGRAQLLALAADAEQRGYLRIAREARAAAR